MPLTKEQVDAIKQQLMTQLENFPEDKRDQIKEQILSMTDEQVEEFVKQNQLGHMEGANCVFCQIIEGKNPSVKIYEDDANLAILELNPLSKGHTLVMPKQHSDNVFPSTEEVAKKIAAKIKEIYKPNKVQIRENKIMGHPLMEVIPLYGNEGERKQASPEELQRVKSELVAKTPVEAAPKIEMRECIMCSIGKGDVMSYKIDENKTSFATLDINPYTRGHVLVLPKEHVSVSKIPTATFSLAKKIAGKITTRLKPEDVRISTSETQGHAFVEVIPLYDDSVLKREKASPEELEKLQKKLEVKKRKKSAKKKSKKSLEKKKEDLSGLPKVKPRIP